MERSEKRNVLLEYYPKGHHFHYNINYQNRPSVYYLPLGWCSVDEADVFTLIVQPLITKLRYDDKEVSIDRMKESWAEYCKIIEK